MVLSSLKAHCSSHPLGRVSVGPAATGGPRRRHRRHRPRGRRHGPGAGRRGRAVVVRLGCLGLGVFTQKTN